MNNRNLSKNEVVSKESKRWIADYLKNESENIIETYKINYEELKKSKRLISPYTSNDPLLCVFVGDLWHREISNIKSKVENEDVYYENYQFDLGEFMIQLSSEILNDREAIVVDGSSIIPKLEDGDFLSWRVKERNGKKPIVHIINPK